jgi:hypothetical protein
VLLGVKSTHANSNLVAPTSNHDRQEGRSLEPPADPLRKNPQMSHIFDVKESQAGNFVASSSTSVTTVDIGVVVGGMRKYHAEMMLAFERLASDHDVDRAIDQLVEELEYLRPKAKQLLGTLKR